MKHTLLFFLLFWISTIQAQSTLKDKESIKKIEYYANINVDSMEYHAKELIQSSNQCFSYIGRISVANAFYKRGLYEQSEERLIKILTELKQDVSKCQNINKLSALNRLFWIKKNGGDYEEAFRLLLRRKKVIHLLDKDEPHTILHQISTDINMANIKSDLNLYNEAIKILTATERRISQLHFNSATPNYYHLLNQKSSLNNILGDNYLQLKKFDSARFYYKRAFDVTQKLVPPHKDSKILYELRLAKVLITNNEYAKALKLVDRYTSKSKNLNTSQDINFLKSLLFHNLAQSDSAKLYCYKFLNFTEKAPSTQKNKIAIYNIIAEQYDLEKNIDSAYKYSQLAIQELNLLNDSKEKVSKSHYLYDFNRVNELNRSILDKESKKRTHIILIFTGIVILVMFLIYAFYKRGKKFSEQYNTTLESFNKNETSSKKAYNIDKSLEEKILHELTIFEKSTEFLDADFSIGKLAKKLNTNTSYLSSIINEKKQKSFKQYTSELRINYLTIQLKSNTKFRKYTVKALAEEIGYTNASAFTRAFKKHTGKTPSDFLNDLT